MSKVFGPFSSSEWETLLSLKKAIEYEKKNAISNSILEKDIADYNDIVNKAA